MLEDFRSEYTNEYYESLKKDIDGLFYICNDRFPLHLFNNVFPHYSKLIQFDHKVYRSYDFRFKILIDILDNILYTFSDFYQLEECIITEESLNLYKIDIFNSTETYIKYRKLNMIDENFDLELKRYVSLFLNSLLYIRTNFLSIKYEYGDTYDDNYYTEFENFLDRAFLN